MGLWLVNIDPGEGETYFVVVVLAYNERSAKVSATRHLTKTYPAARSTSATSVDVYSTKVVLVAPSGRRSSADRPSG